MTISRSLPHESIQPSAVERLLKRCIESVDKNTRRVLSGEHDDIILGQFNGLTRNLDELAIVRYYFEGASAEETLSVIDQVALARANYFKLINGGASPVTIEWQGTKRSVQGYSKVKAVLTSPLQTALNYAVIAGRDDCLQVLTRFELETYEPHVPPDHVAMLYAQFCQHLFGGNEAKARELRDILITHTSAEMNPDVVLGVTRQYVHFSLLDGNAHELRECIENHLAAHKTVYDSDRNNERYAISGLMSMSMLAVAVEAHKRCIDISWNSRYVPDDMVAAVLGRL